MSPANLSQRLRLVASERARQARQRGQTSRSGSSVVQTLLYLQKAAGNAAVTELIESSAEKKHEPPQPQAALPPSTVTPSAPAGNNGSASAPTNGAAPASESAIGVLGGIAGMALPTATAIASPFAGVLGSMFGSSSLAAAPAGQIGAATVDKAPGAVTGGVAAGTATAAGAVGGAAATAEKAASTATGVAAGAAAKAAAKPASGAPAVGAAAGAPAASGPAAAMAGGAVATGVAGPAPAAPTPETDPRFLAVKQRVRGRAMQTKQHPPAAAKVAEAKAAAQGPAGEVASAAGAAQVEKMAAQQPGGFDKPAFMAAVRKAVDAAAPQSLEDADDFKDSGKAAQVGQQVSGLVGQNKDAATKDVKGTTEAPPDTAGIQPKPVTPLPGEDAGAPPASVGAASAMPQPRSAEEVSLAKGPADVNASMKEADVTESQLKESNEPEFTAALDAKGAAEKHSAEAPKAFQQDEKSMLDKAKASATGSASKELGAMHSTRAKGLAAVAAGKTQAKSQDEVRRAEVSDKIQGIYGKTKDEVTAILNGIDPQVDAAFKTGEENARAGFESYVQVHMDAYKDDRYSGWTGGLKWAKDKLFGMPDEVNAFYVKGRELYLDRMDKVIGSIADLVGRELTRAKDRIQQGQVEIQQYVKSLPLDLQKVGQQAQQDIQGKFDELAQAVDAKQEDCVNQLAKKYVESRDAVDARIKEMKEANKGLVDKAIDAVKGVINTIRKLKDMLLNVLAKAVSVIGNIIAHPIKFLGNLVDGIKLGLHNFMANIGEHLKKGLLGWLFGALGDAGLVLPEHFDLHGILSIILQVLGLTYSHIRGLAVGIVGEEVVAHLEKSLEFFQILIKEGPAGLWKWIVEKLSELKETVMTKIKEFIQEKVIIAGIMWLIGLLNPVAAFIKACKAIYDIVKFFIERAEQVGQLVDAILDSVGAIAAGALGEAAGKVENALAKAIPVAIGFLASLLGLGGISDKIRSIIHAIQEPIHNIISKVLGVVLKPFKWIGDKVKAGAAWAKKKVQQGAAFVKDKAKAGASWVKGKLGLGKKDEEDQSKLPPAELHGKIREALDARLGNSLTPEKTRSVISGVYSEFQPQGLKQLYLEPAEGKVGVFNIKAVASPATTVKQALAQMRLNIGDLRFRSGTWCTASVNGRQMPKTVAEGEDEEGPGRHAEENMIEALNANWASLAPDPGKPVVLTLQISRSPCGPTAHDCAGQLNQFVRERRAAGYKQLTMTIQIASLYEGRTVAHGEEGGPVAGESIVNLLELAEEGHRIEVLDLVAAIERRLGRKLVKGELPEALEKKLNQKAAYLNEALDEIGVIRSG